jgi:poly(beta-D-mannuronate) lyase
MSLRISLFLLITTSALAAKDLPVADPTAFRAVQKQLQPGDVLVLAEGLWADSDLEFKAEGTKDQPITVKAAVPGKTIFTGNSRLQISGRHIVVEGLWFRDPGQTTGEVIELRTDSDELAYDCVVRNCAVTQAQPIDLGKKTARFLSVYGTGHVIERCHFEGKTTGGTTAVVWLQEGLEAKHVFRANYFGQRQKLGKNGGETIRIGDSESAHLNARCEVVGNLFYQCNGEGEIISVKSNENHFAGNTFLECEGALTLRHAHRCVVEKNVFIGNGKKMTGGVRIIGEDHVIKNNYLENLKGEDYRSAFTFMKGIPNSPANGYYEVKRVQLIGNTAINCEETLSIGEGSRKEATLPPRDCMVKDNVFISPKKQLVFPLSEMSGWTWENNVMIGKSIGIEGLAGVVTAEPKDIAKLKPLARTDVGVSWTGIP